MPLEFSPDCRPTGYSPVPGQAMFHSKVYVYVHVGCRADIQANSNTTIAGASTTYWQPHKAMEYVILGPILCEVRRIRRARTDSRRREPCRR